MECTCIYIHRNMTTARHFRSGMMMGMGGMMMPPRGPPQNVLVIGGSVADLDMAAGMYLGCTRD